MKQRGPRSTTRTALIYARRARRSLRNQDDLDDDPNLPDNVPYNDIRYADSSPNARWDTDFDFAPDSRQRSSRRPRLCSRTRVVMRRADRAHTVNATRATVPETRPHLSI